MFEHLFSSFSTKSFATKRSGNMGKSLEIHCEVHFLLLVYAWWVQLQHSTFSEFQFSTRVDKHLFHIGRAPRRDAFWARGSAWRRSRKGEARLNVDR